MNQGDIIRHAIEELYGRCPAEDFIRANEWSSAIDWEDVKETVEAEHPDFQWTHHDPKELEVAEAMVIDVRHEMLQEAGHRFPPSPDPNE
jgi:hypothetical protein